MTKLNLDRWSPELRRALIAVRPEFFSWPVDQQTHYRLALPDNDRAAIVKLLVSDIDGGAAAAERVTLEDDGRLPLDLQHRLNELLLPLEGIGEDAFYLNEHLGEDLSILNFGTLRAYDEYDHQYQENARATEDPAYEPKPYVGNFYGCWARVLVGKRLVYLTLSMAAGYLYDQISSAATDELQRRIPHRYVSGRDDGKKDGDMIRWDMRIDAGGQEALFEELQARIWDYERRQWAALQAEHHAIGRRRTYTIDTSAHGESNLHIVFSDQEVLGAIHPETFMSDCRKLEGDIGELHTAAAAEVKRIHEFIAEQHADLLVNFDPKVTRLRKRKKILMHPRARDDLTDME